MADATVVIGGDTITVDLLGAQGPRGFNGPDMTDLAASDGADQVGYGDTETVGDILRQVVRVSSSGADPTGATSSSVAFDAAGASAGAGGHVMASPGLYKASSVALQDGQLWDGQNATVQTETDTATIFLVDGVQDWRISGFNLVGRLTTGVDPDAELETGLAVKNATRGIVSNMTFSSFKKVGLHRNAAAFTLDPDVGRGARTLGYGLGFYECTIGLKTEAHGGNEYDIFSTLHAGGCKVGMDLTAGNTIVVGFHLVDNYQNLRLRGGANNHLHGILAAGTINHTQVGGDYLGRFTDVWNGHTLSAIHAYANNVDGDGPLFYERCGGINWLGGILDAYTYIDQRTFDATAHYPYNRQENLFLPGSYGPAKIYGRKPDNSGWDEYSPFIIRRKCFGPGLIDAHGITTNDPADLYIVAEHTGAATTIAQGDFLKFATSSGVGDRRKAHNPATGLVTIPKWMTGQYEYAAAFAISGTLTTPAQSYFELVLSPGGSEVLLAPAFIPAPFNTGTSLWTIITGTISMHLTEGDIIGLRATSLTGSAPLLGHVSWRSQFWLKKIA